MFKDLFSLKGRVALVTGGSRGIGKMIAAGFLEPGRRQGLHHRAQGRRLRGDREGADGGIWRRMHRAADRHFDHGRHRDAGRPRSRSAKPKLDILVNNAGAAWGADFDEFPESGWDKVMNLNLKTPFFLTKALAAPLRAAATAERPAKVINIASIDGIFVNPMETYSYAASKSGLIHLTRRMAVKLISDHIVVTAIAPGPFKSDMNKAARDNADEVAQRVPAGRIGTDEDMAGAAIYLASRAGDYVVGATIAVDGGIVYANPGIKGDGGDSGARDRRRPRPALRGEREEITSRSSHIRNRRACCRCRPWAARSRGRIRRSRSPASSAKR